MPAADHDPGPAAETPSQPAAPRAADAEPERAPADIEADARLHVAIYPDRVRRIRAAGGLPPDLDFGPPELDIVQAILRGTGLSQVPAAGDTIQ